MYGLIWLTDLRNKMESVDLLIMLTSAVCHDLDHAGYNNAYQVPTSPTSITSRLLCHDCLSRMPIDGVLHNFVHH